LNSQLKADREYLTLELIESKHMTRIVVATESDRARVLAPLVTGFVEDPVMRWCWPEPDEYLANISRFADAYGGKAFSLGSAWADDQNRGTALWLGPGEQPDEDALVSIITSTLNDKKQKNIFTALEELESYHPQEPHWLFPLSQLTLPSRVVVLAPG
jgi:hypothetical protein